VIRNRLALWILDRLPHCLRSRWPLRRFYWQADEIESAEREAERLRTELGW